MGDMRRLIRDMKDDVVLFDEALQCVAVVVITIAVPRCVCGI